MIRDRVRRTLRAASVSPAFARRCILTTLGISAVLGYPFTAFAGWRVHRDLAFYFWTFGEPLRFVPLRYAVAGNVVAAVVILAFLMWVAPSEDRLELLELGGGPDADTDVHTN